MAMFLEKTRKYLIVNLVFLAFFSPACWGMDDTNQGESGSRNSKRKEEETKTKEMPSISDSKEQIIESSSSEPSSKEKEKEEEIEIKIKKMTPINENDVKQYPHCAVFSLTSYFQEGPSVIRKPGTGFLINDHLALTAAHTVIHEGKLVDQIFCRMSRHGANYEKVVQIKKYVFPEEYLEKSKNRNRKGENQLKFDYALLYFDDKIELIHFINPVDDHDTEPLILCGYPGEEYNKVNQEKDHVTVSYPYETQAILEEKQTDIIIFRTPGYKGMSGSPVRFHDKETGNWKAMAIFSAAIRKDEHGNPIPPITIGCLFTEEKLTRIHKWRVEIMKDTPEADKEHAIFNTKRDLSPVAIGNYLMETKIDEWLNSHQIRQSYESIWHARPALHQEYPHPFDLYCGVILQQWSSLKFNERQSEADDLLDSLS
jgi:V8-like Glu-specific endopeptidase